MTTARIVLEGKTFGRLTVLTPIRERGKAIKYRCKCQCGTFKTVIGQHLRLQRSQSCGCLQKERTRLACLQHGRSRTTIHNTWLSMLQRCDDDKCTAYRDYGGRGITVCDRWRLFENFLADMGEPPKGMTLDRKNNDLGYSKDNCQWASRMQQANNRRSSKFHTLDGRTQTQAQWAREAGISQQKLHARLKRGWPLRLALNGLG